MDTALNTSIVNDKNVTNFNFKNYFIFHITTNRSSFNLGRCNYAHYYIKLILVVIFHVIFLDSWCCHL